MPTEPEPEGTLAIEADIDRLVFGAGRHEPATIEGPEFHRILVGYDGSEPATLALDWARTIARVSRAEVVLAQVIPAAYSESYDMGQAWWWSVERDLERSRNEAHDRLMSMCVGLAKEGIAATDVVSTGSATREIAHVAQTRHADLVIVGAHARGLLGQALLGSTADAIRHRTAASVLVARNAPTPSEILIPVDGSPSSRRAARVGLRFAEEWRAHVTLFHVIEAPNARAQIPPLEQLVEEMKFAPRDDRVVHALGVGHPADEIIARAKADHADLVIMGSRGLGALRGTVVGSVSNRVAHEVGASVLTVRATEAEGA